MEKSRKARAVMEAEELRALMDERGLSPKALAEATKYSATHINDLCSGRRTISERVRTNIMNALDKLTAKGRVSVLSSSDTIVKATTEPIDVCERTEYFRLRNIGNRRVLTIQDIADGFGVDKDNVARAFGNHRDKWVDAGYTISRSSSPAFVLNNRIMEPNERGTEINAGTFPQSVETFLSDFPTPGGVQSVRFFTLRGAMRFAFYLQSGVVEQVRSHILDLLEKEAKELASSSQGNQQWTPAANVPHYGPPAWLPAMMEALGANVIGMKGEIQSLAAGLHQKVDREEVLHLVESKVHASADINQGHIAQEVFNLQKQDKNAHRLKRNKLHDRVNRLVYLRLAKHHGGVIPDEIKAQERKELNRRVNTAVAGGHGLKSWPRDSYDDQDFQAAHIALDKYAREHGIQEATQLKVLEGGKL
jgi:transcriptional regulator with XRE-family HTH domain